MKDLIERLETETGNLPGSYLDKEERAAILATIKAADALIPEIRKHEQRPDYWDGLIDAHDAYTAARAALKGDK